MKNKTLSLVALTILSLVMIAGLTSAVNLNAISIVSSPSNVSSNAGSFNIIFNLTNVGTNGTLYYTLSNFTSSQSGLSFSSFSDSFIAEGNLTNPTTETITATISFNNGQTGTITGNINVGNSPTAMDKTLAFSVPIIPTTLPTSDIPDKITACSAIGTHGNDLRIEIDDLQVTEGFGDDTEWLPLDEIEVQIKVENDGDEKIRNIEVRWGLYDKVNDKWYIDEKENDFNLGDGDDKTITITFKLDEDIDELDEGDYVFYAWANGEIDDVDDTNVCASDSQNIDMIIENDFVILDSIQVPETARCSSEVELTADVWNIGGDDQEGVYVLINSRDLGVINKKITIGDVDAFDSAKLSTIINIPKVEEGKFYQIDMHVYTEDNEVYQNDFDDDDAKFQTAIKVQGNCEDVPSATVSATLQSGGKAGEPLVVKSIVTSEESGTYVLKVTGYTDWATTDTTQFPLVLTANTPKDVSLTFNVNEDASGSKTFNLELLSGTETVLTQPVSVSIEESSSGFSFGNLNFGGNAYLWGIAILNVLLVIIIIIVAIKVAAK